jgi:hypothetical protein
MTDGISDAPDRREREWLIITLGAGCLIAGWDFCMMFSAWVVTSQAEIIAGNIFFFCLGVMPPIGIIGYRPWLHRQGFYFYLMLSGERLFLPVYFSWYRRS